MTSDFAGAVNAGCEAATAALELVVERRLWADHNATIRVLLRC